MNLKCFWPSMPIKSFGKCGRPHLLHTLAWEGSDDSTVSHSCRGRALESSLETCVNLLPRIQRFFFRFTLLKKTLDEVMRSYPQLAAPGTASAAGGASTSDPAKTAEEVNTHTTKKNPPRGCACLIGTPAAGGINLGVGSPNP